jgi:tetratricopeptide (TPR) repeat protein
MEGIQMLRNIAEKDPKNTQAQFYLGIFSLQTGQFEKAKERFETVLNIEPNSLEAHLYYSDALAQLGETESAIKELETASGLTDNEELKNQINKRIEQLKNM